MKGQTRIEFIFGVIVFCVLIFFIVSHINTIFTSMTTDYDSNTVKAEAENVIGMLTKYTGSPEDWNKDSMQSLGLLDKRTGQLSNEKIDALGSNCSMMDGIVSNYRLKIYNSSGMILMCGSETLKPPKVIASKSLVIGGSFGNVTLELW
jgi:hypothetical protein